MIEKQHQEWKKDLEELHEVKAENKRLKKDVNALFDDQKRLAGEKHTLQAENEKMKKKLNNILKMLDKADEYGVGMIKLQKESIRQALKGGK